MVLFNYNKSHKNLVPRLSPSTHSFIAGGAIYSSKNNKILRPTKNIVAAKSANYPIADIGIRLTSGMSVGINRRNRVLPNIAPVNKPKNRNNEHHDEDIGVAYNIWSFDILDLFNPISLISGFTPANMVAHPEGLVLEQKTVPLGSAYVTTYSQFKINRLDIVNDLVDRIKNFPPFSNIPLDPVHGDRNRRLAAGRFLLKNNFVPRFIIPNIRNFSSDTIKYSYCKYDTDTLNLTEEMCGLIEEHEIAYLQGKIGNIFAMFVPAYTIVTYPVILYPFVPQPMCDLCFRWVVYCTWLSDQDSPIVLEIYDELFHGENVENPELNLKLFSNYDKALKFAEQQRAIPIEQYKWVSIDGECRPIHPLCYNSENWTEQFPPDDYVLYDSVEDCLEGENEDEYGVPDPPTTTPPPDSSEEESIFLENIELFQQYSLDPDLIDLYFNKGVFAQEIDLDILLLSSLSSNHSSSSSGFYLTIEVQRLVRDPFGEPYVLPEDLHLYIYDEKVDGVATPGILEVTKITGLNFVTVGMSSNSLEDAQEVSFQINIEHPSISSIRKIFLFKNQKEYTHVVYARPPVIEENSRLSSSYSAYLLGWIQDFWLGYNASDPSLVPEFNPPSDSLNFFPLEHARWKLSKQLMGSLNTSGLPVLFPGNKEILSGWNFLGVSAETWKCINTPNNNGNRLGKADNKADRIFIEIEDFRRYIIEGKYRRGRAEAFDCRAFTAAMMFFLRSQLLLECPSAVIKAQTVENPDLGKGHVLILVQLNPLEDPAFEPCCKGSFILEPQSGVVYDQVEENFMGLGPDGLPVESPSYCDQFPEYCGIGFESWTTIEPGSENIVSSWSPLAWHQFPEQLERIKDAICGCIAPLNHPESSAEKMIQSKCNDNTFKEWFKDNFAYEPERINSLMTDMPQILSCDRVICNEELLLCQPDNNGYEPYVCEIKCVEEGSSSITEGYENYGQSEKTYSFNEETQKWEII